jgi:hypothetical protein
MYVRPKLRRRYCGSDALQIATALRVLRAIKPLRMLTRR